MLPAFLALLYSSSVHSAWTTLEEGLEIEVFPACRKSQVDDSRITVVRADLSHFRLQLGLASEESDRQAMLADRWAEKKNFVVTINAGMFATGHSTHVGYLRNEEERIQNRRVALDYKSLLAFEPKQPHLPGAMMHDLESSPIHIMEGRYKAIIQNLRLIKAPGKSVWGRSNKRWSEAAVGMDSRKRILFIFSRSPYSMHDFSNCLLQLPLGIVRAQHLEGGPEATLVIRTPKLSTVLVGSYETGFNDGVDGNYHDNRDPVSVPNVIGLVRIK